MILLPIQCMVLAELDFFTLTNHNNNTSIVDFPAGLVFLPDNDSAQNVMTVYPVKITLPSESSEKVRLMGFCINEEKYVGFANYFTTGAVSNNDQVTTLTNNLKNISESVLSEQNNILRLQEIVWNISDGDGLTQANLDTINAW